MHDLNPVWSPATEPTAWYGVYGHLTSLVFPLILKWLSHYRWRSNVRSLVIGASYWHYISRVGKFAIFGDDAASIQGSKYHVKMIFASSSTAGECLSNTCHYSNHSHFKMTEVGIQSSKSIYDYRTCRVFLKVAANVRFLNTRRARLRGVWSRWRGWSRKDYRKPGMKRPKGWNPRKPRVVVLLTPCFKVVERRHWFS